MKNKLKLCIGICLMLGICSSCNNTSETNSIDYTIYESAYGVKGTEIYCWEITDNDFRCGALAGTNRNKTYEELKTIQDDYSCPLETMKKILANYPEETRKYASIFIINYPLEKVDFVGRIPNEETLIYLRNKLGLL